MPDLQKTQTNEYLQDALPILKPVNLLLRL